MRVVSNSAASKLRISRSISADCHEPGNCFLPLNVEDLLRLEFRWIDSAPPNFASAKLQSERNEVRISTFVIAALIQDL